jgi:hypothetical protein
MDKVDSSNHLTVERPRYILLGVRVVDDNFDKFQAQRCCFLKGSNTQCNFGIFAINHTAWGAVTST